MHPDLIRILAMLLANAPQQRRPPNPRGFDPYPFGADPRGVPQPSAGFDPYPFGADPRGIPQPHRQHGYDPYPFGADPRGIPQPRRHR